MTLDDTLRDVLHDDRWALAVPPATMDAVRRGRAARRHRTAVAAVACGLAVAGGALAVVSLAPDHRASLATFAAGGAPAGQPVPGISPPFVPTSGRDWVLTHQQYTAYGQVHTHPSPGPGQSVVASPAPLGQQSAELLAAVQAATLPPGTDLRREDSVGGQPGSAAVHGKLPDGTPFEVVAQALQEPYDYQSRNGEQLNPDASVENVPGTTSVLVLYPTAGYGFSGYDANTARAVAVVTRGGYETTWVAPPTVSLADLRAWALAGVQAG